MCLIILHFLAAQLGAGIFAPKSQKLEMTFVVRHSQIPIPIPRRRFPCLSKMNSSVLAFFRTRLVVESLQFEKRLTHYLNGSGQGCGSLVLQGAVKIAVTFFGKLRRDGLRVA